MVSQSLFRQSKHKDLSGVTVTSMADVISLAQHWTIQWPTSRKRVAQSQYWPCDRVRSPHSTIWIWTWFPAAAKARLYPRHMHWYKCTEKAANNVSSCNTPSGCITVPSCLHHTKMEASVTGRQNWTGNPVVTWLSNYWMPDATLNVQMQLKLTVVTQ